LSGDEEPVVVDSDVLIDVLRGVPTAAAFLTILDRACSAAPYVRP
jgi:hypothetical protein